MKTRKELVRTFFETLEMHPDYHQPRSIEFKERGLNYSVYAYFRMLGIPELTWITTRARKLGFGVIIESGDMEYSIFARVEIYDVHDF